MHGRLEDQDQHGQGGGAGWLPGFRKSGGDNRVVLRKDDEESGPSPDVGVDGA